MNQLVGEPARLTEAADWLQRLQSEPRNESLVAEWADWCQADPRNLAAFERIEAVWNALDAPGARSAAVRPTTGVRARSARLSGIGSRVPLALAASLVLGVSAAIAAWWYLGRTKPLDHFQTQTAQVRTFTLEDGSTLTMGPESYVYARYTRTKRQLVIAEGQAYFEVVKDPTRPFIVRAADKDITAVGTRFETRLDGGSVSVAVTEGRVAISAASSSGQIAASPVTVFVTAGQHSIARANGSITAPTPSKTADPTAWRKGQLQYIDEPLGAVIADVNRYTLKKIVLTEPELRDRLYTGTVYRERIDDWVKALEEVFPIHAEADQEQITLKRRKLSQETAQ